VNLSTVILAAGLGTRMKSLTPKLLHSVCGKPIIKYVADAVATLKADKNIIIVGPDDKEIRTALTGYSFTLAVQKEQKGTADALKAAVKKLKGFDGTILILNGDTPLIEPSTLQKFLKIHNRNKEDISIISFIVEGDHSYGRIIRDKKSVRAIIEDRDADREQKKIKEVNSGIYAMKSHILKLLKGIKMNKKKGEYYLTDIVDIAAKKGCRIGAHLLGNEMELTGINTREDLYKASHYLSNKIVAGWMNRGVSFIDKTSVFIHPEVEIGMDTIIYPNVHIEGKTIIGNDCVIYPNTRIANSIIGNGVVIKDSTIIESSTIKDKAAVGPFAHLRPDSVIGSFSKIGNFVEIKKAAVGEGTKASHLSYIGDAEIGRGVNIGAGTITCNYDGKVKHKTVIEDDAFIGSDTQLVAPVKVGKGAYVGAGSTITKDVPSLSLAVSRTAQVNIENWAIKKQSKVGSRQSAVSNKQIIHKKTTYRRRRTED
jgi:bifunctional UDP-N-acetylglucosamine pyrophosphorylase/glucosamine-1-phosphate N-acetyltransferase